MIFAGADDWWTLAIAVLCAVTCAIPGTFMVLRRMSMMSDAISHTVLPGIVLAFIVTQGRDSLAMLIGAAILGVVTAMLTQFVHRWGRMEGSSAMGVVFTSLFALGLVLIARGVESDSIALDADCVLYGNLEMAWWDTLTLGGVEIPRAVVTLAVVLLLNIALVMAFFKELKLVCFDRDLARTLGIPVWAVHYGLMIMVAITIVVSFELVGSIMVIALIIVPAAAAWLWCERVWSLLLLAVGFAAGSAVLGIVGGIVVPPWLSIGEHQFAEANFASSIAVAAGLIFACSHFGAPRHGLLARVFRRFHIRRRQASEDVLGLLFKLDELTSEQETDTAFLAEATGLGRWQLAAALRFAQRNAWLTRVANNWLLTEDGREAARRIVRSHRLWEAYLQKHLGLAADHLHEPAHRLEHIDDPILESQLQDDLGHPEQDPHGRAMP